MLIWIIRKFGPRNALLMYKIMRKIRARAKEMDVEKPFWQHKRFWLGIGGIVTAIGTLLFVGEGSIWQILADNKDWVIWVGGSLFAIFSAKGK